jgi:hypothetical protein
VWIAENFTSLDGRIDAFQGNPEALSGTDTSEYVVALGFNGLINTINQKREHPPSTERISLTKECGWKDGDRGGLAEWEQTHGKKKAKFALTSTGLLMEGVSPLTVPIIGRQRNSSTTISRPNNRSLVRLF